MNEYPLLRPLMLAAAALVASLPAAAQTNPPVSAAQRWALAHPCGLYTSVEQLPDSRVTFRLCAPEAREVSLATADVPQMPMATGLPMVKDAVGLWSVTTDPIAPDVYRYNFRVDGVRVVDPLATTYSEERTGTNGTFEVKGPSGDFQTYNPDIPHGSVAEIRYWSASLGIPRRAHVYLPPGYDGSCTKYPVLYLIHGAGDSDDSWTSVGHANYIFDNLIAAGKAVPMIVVMPNGHTPQPPQAALRDMLANPDFGTDFFKDLVPYVETHYRTLNDSGHRAMAGLSMGGSHTLLNGVPHPELFRSIGVFSMGLLDDAQRTDYEAANAAALDRGAREFKVFRYYIGKDDMFRPTVPPTLDLLERHGIKIDYIESTGGHNWINWRRYLNDFAPYLFK